MSALRVIALLAAAQGAAWAADKPPPEPRTPVKEASGAVSWEKFANVSMVKQHDRYVPQFPKEIAALDKKEVKLQGFMMPLEVGAKQKRFLLSAMPPECGFCLPGGPEQFVEVQAKSAVKYVLDPIVVSGTLALVHDDAGGLLYRLIEAVPVEK
jgi:hypothetical protein